MARKKRSFPWIGAVGMFLIFASWFVQNTYDAELAGARRNLDSSVNNIMLAAATADMWTERYFELKSAEKPRQEQLLMGAAFKALQWHLIATKIADDRASDDDWILSLAKNEDTLYAKTHDKLVERFKEKRLSELEADLITFVQMDNTMYMRSNFNSKFYSRVVELSEKKSWIQAVIILLYTVGTLLAIWDFAVRESK